MRSGGVADEWSEMARFVGSKVVWLCKEYGRASHGRWMLEVSCNAKPVQPRPI